MSLEEKKVEKIVKVSLEEDVVTDDITAKVIDLNMGSVSAAIIAKQSGILCGTEVAETVFSLVSEQNSVEILADDGSRIEDGLSVMRITGSPADLLRAERTALNFLSHMSGIATLTSRYVAAVKSINTGCRILDTRKTLPGLRYLEKYAVRTGGGSNHRMNLSDQVLIKENHIRASAGTDIVRMMEGVMERVPENIIVEIEVENLDQFRKVAASGAHIIMLDNFADEDIREAVRIRDELGMGSVLLEVSGGMDLERAAAAAAAGVERISLGSITHSAPAADFSMLFDMS